MLSSPHLCCSKSSSVSPLVHPHTIPGQLQKKISGRRQDQWQDPQQWSHCGRRQDQSSRSMALLIPSLYGDVQQSITSLPLFYMIFIIYRKCKATYVQYLVHTNTTKWIIYKLSALLSQAPNTSQSDPPQDRCFFTCGHLRPKKRVINPLYSTI